MAIALEKKQARWLRNKRAERARAKPAERPLSFAFIRRVLAERKARFSSAVVGSNWWKENTYLTVEQRERAVYLVLDVWAATVLIEARWGKGAVRTTHICKQLIRKGRTHGYTEGSLRKMVSKARERIAVLETCGEYLWSEEQCWVAFDFDSGAEMSG